MNPPAGQQGCSCGPPRKKDQHKGCPVNGEKGRPLASETLRHLIHAATCSEIKNSGYYFCRSEECDTVYYHPESGQCFDKCDLIVRVGLKETEDPVWLCYCFNISKKMIQEEIELMGKSASGDRIRYEVAAKNCECEIKNPSGRCCLADVLSAEKEAWKNRGKAPQLL